jgi:hypothetical protein
LNILVLEKSGIYTADQLILTEEGIGALFCHCLSLWIPGTHFLLYTIDNWKEQSHSVHFCVFHQASWHPAYTHFVVFRFFIIMTCYFPRIVPPLVLHSHLPTMCFDDQCDPHGCSFNHCWTLYAIFCYAALSLCHHHMPRVSWQWISLQETCFTHKIKTHYRLFRGARFPVLFPLYINLSMNNIWLTDSCIGIACYPYYKCCLLPKNKMVVWQKHFRLENVTSLPSLACQVYWALTLKVCSKISLQCILVKNSPYFTWKLYWTYHIS